MTWSRLPLFLWAMYATSLIMVLATPVLAVSLVLVVMERCLRIGIFDPELGGDPVLFQHLFWFYSHPAVYIMVLPGVGGDQRDHHLFFAAAVFGYTFIGYSSFAIAVLGFLVWGHHMFVSGQSVYAGIVFSFLSFFVAIPSADQGVQLDGHALQGPSLVRNADALCPGLHWAVHHGGADRAVSVDVGRSTCTCMTPILSSPISITSWSAAR